MNRFVMLLLLVFIFSCSQDQSLDLKSPNFVPGAIEVRDLNEDFTPFNIPFPEGTRFTIVGSELKFTLPEPYYIVGVDIEGNYYKSDPGGSGGVVCEFKKGRGCDPVKSEGEYGCLMKNDCSECKKSKAKIAGIDVDLVDIIIMNPDFNLFVTKFDQLDAQFLLPATFLNYSEISDFIVLLENSFLPSEVETYKIVFISVYGYILPIEIPSDIDNTSIAFINEIDRGEICKCLVEGDCPKKKKLIVVYCDSKECTKCSMSGKIVNEGGASKQFSEADGLILLN